jgi:hypothetical protein
MSKKPLQEISLEINKAIIESDESEEKDYSYLVDALLSDDGSQPLVRLEAALALKNLMNERKNRKESEKERLKRHDPENYCLTFQ